MWLAKVEWGVIGPILSGSAAFGGLIYAAWQQYQKRKANGKAASAFKLIDQLQEQLESEWKDKDRLRQTIRNLQIDFDSQQDQIRRARETEIQNDELFQENQRLKRENADLLKQSKPSSARKRGRGEGSGT